MAVKILGKETFTPYYEILDEEVPQIWLRDTVDTLSSFLGVEGESKTKRKDSVKNKKIEQVRMQDITKEMMKSMGKQSLFMSIAKKNKSKKSKKRSKSGVSSVSAESQVSSAAEDDESMIDIEVEEPDSGDKYEPVLTSSNIRRKKNNASVLFKVDENDSLIFHYMSRDKKFVFEELMAHFITHKFIRSVLGLSLSGLKASTSTEISNALWIFLSIFSVVILDKSGHIYLKNSGEWDFLGVLNVIATISVICLMTSFTILFNTTWMKEVTYSDSPEGVKYYSIFRRTMYRSIKILMFSSFLLFISSVFLSIADGSDVAYIETASKLASLGKRDLMSVALVVILPVVLTTIPFLITRKLLSSSRVLNQYWGLVETSSYAGFLASTYSKLYGENLLDVNISREYSHLNESDHAILNSSGILCYLQFLSSTKDYSEGILFKIIIGIRREKSSAMSKEFSMNIRNFLKSIFEKSKEDVTEYSTSMGGTFIRDELKIENINIQEVSNLFDNLNREDDDWTLYKYFHDYGEFNGNIEDNI